MSVISITYGTPISMNVSLTELASRNGKTFADITDVLYMLKKEAWQDDTDAVFSKSVKGAGGITLNPANNSFALEISPTDYGDSKIEKEETYLVCIGVEFNDSGFIIEDYDPQFERKLAILADKIRS